MAYPTVIDPLREVPMIAIADRSPANRLRTCRVLHIGLAAEGCRDA